MVSDSYLPYGKQQVDEEDIAAVVEVLKSDWLTTGPTIERFEQAVADYVGAKHAVAVSSGTAALHAAVAAAGIGSGDEVIVSCMSFVATANAIVYMGGTPVFADIVPETLLINPAHVEALITAKTKAIIAVDYAGQPCDYAELNRISEKYGLLLIADSSHSLGARLRGKACGVLADMSTFSFHPVKPLTSGEGGMVVTDNTEWANRIRRFRNHGICQDHHSRQQASQFEYDVVDLGFNYRLSDVHAALGLSQLSRLDDRIRRRNQIADQYFSRLGGVNGVRLLTVGAGVVHGFHLFVIRIPGSERHRIFLELRRRGIGVNVHYRPIHLHPYYQKKADAFRSLLS